MLQRSFYLPEKLYSQLQAQAKAERIAVAQLIRKLLDEGVKRKKKQEQKGAKFLLNLGKYNLKGGPKDLAKNHDKHTWE